MANTGSSPLEALVEATGNEVVSAFKCLGNETRLAIMLALWEAFTPWPSEREDPNQPQSLSFSDLRERVDVTDSGRFNYHLGQLEGHYVERTEDGYRLLPPGMRLVQTVLAGIGFRRASLEPTAVDVDCPVCGSTTEITYRDNRLFQICPDCDGLFSADDTLPTGGPISRFTVNPTVLRRGSPEEILASVFAEVIQRSIMQAQGICPVCSGPVESRLEICDEHSAEGELCEACGRRYQPAVLSVCTVCKHSGRASLTGFGIRHPAVQAFYWRQGWRDEQGFHYIDLAMEPILRRLVEETLLSEDPPMAQLTFRDGDEELRLIYDETMTVVELEGAR